MAGYFHLSRFNFINNLVQLQDAPFVGVVVLGFRIDGHLAVEVLLLITIIFLLFQKSYRPQRRPLTKTEIDDLCKDWVPEPLHPPITNEMEYEAPILESAAGPKTIVNGKEMINLFSANYLGLIGHKKITEACNMTLKKYGVGSCGSRLFYGTTDVHLICEERISKFLGSQNSILYSYGLATTSSAIPAFCKRGDLIIVDEGVHWGIRNGLNLSRSTVKYFKHNDMESLEKILESVILADKKTKKILNRRFIVVEGIYQNSGQIVPLDKIVKLKEKFKFRVLLDESNSFGVLGSTGRGLTEHFGMPIDCVDIVTAGMGHALATTGGFCTGSAKVIDQQILNGQGYIFSASLPPFSASAAISAINVLEESPELICNLRENTALLWKGISCIQGLKVVSHSLSPLIFIQLRITNGTFNDDVAVLQKIADHVLHDGFLLGVTRRSLLDDCKLSAGIRMYASAGHAKSDLLQVIQSLKKATEDVLS